MEAKKTKSNLNLSAVSPVIPADGHAFGINTDGTINLLFFQVVNKNEKFTSAVSVSIVKLSSKQLENLRDSINDALNDSKKMAKS